MTHPFHTLIILARASFRSGVIGHTQHCSVNVRYQSSTWVHGAAVHYKGLMSGNMDLIVQLRLYTKAAMVASI